VLHRRSHRRLTWRETDDRACAREDRGVLALREILWLALRASTKWVAGLGAGRRLVRDQRTKSSVYGREGGSALPAPHW
jgi:hypothetical protein